MTAAEFVIAILLIVGLINFAKYAFEHALQIIAIGAVFYGIYWGYIVF